MKNPDKRNWFAVDRRGFIESAALAAAVLLPDGGQTAMAQMEPSAEAGTAGAARALVARNFPGREDAFAFTLVPRAGVRDHFALSSDAGRVVIEGSSALSLCCGLNWYLKYFAKKHWSWCGKNWDLPDELPEVGQPVRVETPYLHNGYFNYCTYNYTMSWWNWQRWERELDYMAMNGVTFPLTITGVESVWLNFLLRLGYTREEAKRFICGPAYFAWWLMGNLEGFGGPLPDSWIETHLDLGQKIVARMREFGMTPMLQGFVGLVPSTFAARKPGAKIIPQGNWCEDFERPHVLDPTDPLFPELAQIWYEELEKLFGPTRYFAGDLFHEGGKTAGVDLAAAGAAVHRAMEAASPGAVWVLQGWGGNPKPGMMRGLQPGQALILDLFADQNPAWPARQSWGGHPWVWNTIVNFGGNPGMFGRMPIEARDPAFLLNNPLLARNLTGIGTTPEAIDNNPVVWDLHFEMFWRREKPDLSQWVKDYAERRYGSDNASAASAWQVLLATAYNAGHKSCQTSLINCRPSTMASLKKPPAWASSAATYDHAEFVEAARLMHEAASELAGRDAFDYDLVDVTRQFLSNLAFPLAGRVRDDFLARDREAYAASRARMIELFEDLDALLATRREFMLGAWIADARALGTTEAEKDLYEWNARNLVTCWTFKKGQLNDYSRREWSGLIKDYYLPRWRAFLDYHSALLAGENPPAPDYFIEIEKPFADRRDAYPSETAGPAAPAAIAAIAKYMRFIADHGIY